MICSHKKAFSIIIILCAVFLSIDANSYAFYDDKDFRGDLSKPDMSQVRLSLSLNLE